MNLNIKATGFTLTPLLEDMVRAKLLSPIHRRMGGELSEDAPLRVELAKITKHHISGKIWSCEVNFNIPEGGKSVYARATEESLEAAIDVAKDEIEREINKHKGRRNAKFLRLARRLKKDLHISRLARWFRRGRIREEGL